MSYTNPNAFVKSALQAATSFNILNYLEVLISSVQSGFNYLTKAIIDLRSVAAELNLKCFKSLTTVLDSDKNLTKSYLHLD
jgi:hypothetical protein